jgi:methylated-DNA-[protein]-cysteine S-methyltransferase
MEVYTAQYLSPLGAMTLACDNQAILGLWFNDQKYFGSSLPDVAVMAQTTEHPLLKQATRWLDIYFSGHNPNFLPPLRVNSTPFRKRVCTLMLTIPYGKTMTYGELARILAKEKGLEKMSAQAVGTAVGHNPICLMIPCHRVVGSDGSLTGYAGGLDRKIKLLELEGLKV